MNLQVNDFLFLSPPAPKDRHSLVKYLNEKEIYNNTLTIPFPYTLSDADWFINHTETLFKENDRVSAWFIRNKQGEAIGGIGFMVKYGTDSHKDEIGYWLAKPYWNRGWMTQIVKTVCDHAFYTWGLKRIEATVFLHNTSSCRVLEKARFELEGTLRKYFVKNNNYLDAYLYALIK